MSVIERLKNYILADGFHVVADPKKSHESWVIDAETGKRYLDCYSQFASQALGWNHPMTLAFKDSLGEVAIHKFANSDMYTESYADFVEVFASVTPDFKHYFFIDGGALAVENALKAAFDWKAQKDNCKKEFLDVIHLKEAFHGRTGYTMSLTNAGEDWNSDENIKTKWFPRFNWSRVTNPKIRFPMQELRVGNLEKMALDEIKSTLESKRVAAIIMEPIQGEGGDNHFRKEFFEGVRKLADDYNAMLIFDEVQTGLGLTGKMWAYEHFGVVPDMMCFGKKTQVCGFCATERIDEVKDNVFAVSGRINSTWGGNTVDMLRSRIIMNIIKGTNLVERTAQTGEYFKSKLEGLDESLGVTNVRGRGLMLAMDLETPEKRDEIVCKLQANMLPLTCGSKGIRFRPHLTFTNADVDKAMEFIEGALS